MSKFVVNVRATQEAQRMFFKDRVTYGRHIGNSRVGGQIRVIIKGHKTARCFDRSFWIPVQPEAVLPQDILDLLDTQDFSNKANVEYAVRCAFIAGQRERKP